MYTQVELKSIVTFKEKCKNLHKKFQPKDDKNPIITDPSLRSFNVRRCFMFSRRRCFAFVCSCWRYQGLRLCSYCFSSGSQGIGCNFCICLKLQTISFVTTIDSYQRNVKRATISRMDKAKFKHVETLRWFLVRRTGSEDERIGINYFHVLNTKFIAVRKQTQTLVLKGRTNLSQK